MERRTGLKWKSYLPMLTLLAAVILVPSALMAASCKEGTISSTGAAYLICMPDNWNGDLLLFAHGFVPPGNTPVIVDNTIGDKMISEIATSLGYAFATTSYRTNGLAIATGADDLLDLAMIFPAVTDKDPSHILLVGASEGGLITALAMEKYPQYFDGGLATCGPVGDFRAQVNYFGDVLVLFNYFFPNVLIDSSFNAATPEGIPEEIMKNWDSSYAAACAAALASSPGRTKQLLKTANIPAAPTFELSVQAIVELLWYNVFSTDDAITKLGGPPYGNKGKWYSGSSNDLLLNLRIKRYSADPNAVAAIQTGGYQTTGRLLRPVVTMHTTADPIVPYWHEPLYTWKTLVSGSALEHVNLPIATFGHCNFTENQVLAGFALLVVMAGAW
jgi:pimeloyl-ACP methyl ester carboxylesterase